MIEKFTKELNTAHGLGRFTVPQMNGVQAMKLFFRLGNKLGPAIAEAAGEAKKGNGARLIGALLSHVEPDEYERIQNEVLRAAHAIFPDQGKTDPNVVQNLGSIFEGHPFELGKLVLFGLEVNFGDFFGGLAARVPSSPSQAAE